MKKELEKVKVRNMESAKGNKIANQFIITTDKGDFFQSYRSIIAFKPHGEGGTVLDSYYWDYSVTTGRYRNLFLNEHKAETQRKIDSGEYLLANLN